MLKFNKFPDDFNGFVVCYFTYRNRKKILLIKRKLSFFNYNIPQDCLHELNLLISWLPQHLKRFLNVFYCSAYEDLETQTYFISGHT